MEFRRFCHRRRPFRRIQVSVSGVLLILGLLASADDSTPCSDLKALYR
jgi:hypothetical protein